MIPAGVAFPLRIRSHSSISAVGGITKYEQSIRMLADGDPYAGLCAGDPFFGSEGNGFLVFAGNISLRVPCVAKLLADTGCCHGDIGDDGTDCATA